MNINQSLLIIYLLVLLPFSTYADTNKASILSFNTNIIINKDASIDVNEVITVNADQKKIKHGIIRQLPLDRNNLWGLLTTTQYKIEIITINNRPILWQTDNNYLSFIIYIGDKALWLSNGIYEFNLQYHINYAIHSNDNVDTLIWNNVQNTWTFPIEKATVNIQLPDNMTISTSSADIASSNPTENMALTPTVAGNKFAVETNQPLMPDQKINIKLTWPAGFIATKNRVGIIETEVFASPMIMIQLGITLFFYLLLFLHSQSKSVWLSK